jgi:hypothetical protein
MPNRILRDWTTSETIDKLSLGAEVFFTRLIMKADDFGNYTGNWKLVKAALFPLRSHNEAQIEVWIDECVNAGIVKKYSVDCKDYLNIPNFGQRLRAMKSQYPGQSNDGHLSDKGRPETKRNETEIESETEASRTLGSGKYYIVIKKKYITDTSYRVQGSDGLQQYFELNGSSINFPDWADKYMRDRNSKPFNEFTHVWNDFDKYVKQQFK